MRNFRVRRKQSGTTLIEILIVMGLLSGMLVVVATIFTSSADAGLQSKTYSSTVSDGRFIMARLDYDITRAASVTTPSTLGGTSPSLSLVIAGSTYTYSLEGDKLRLTDNAGTDILNSDSATVSALSFQELGNTGGKPTIRYSFTLTSTATSSLGRDTQTFTSTAGLR